MGAVCCTSHENHSIGHLDYKLKKPVVDEKMADYDVYTDFEPVVPEQKI